MLLPSDVLELPAGVVERDGRLADDVRGVSLPMNAAALLVVARAGRRLDEIADDLGAAFSVPPGKARDDVLAFVWQLNRLGLANVTRSAGPVASAIAWLALAVRLLPAATLPPTLTRRIALPTGGPLVAARGVARGLAPRAAVAGFATALVVLPAASVTGHSALLLAAMLGGGVGLSLVAHEAGHAAALAGAGPAALIAGWRRLSVVHGPVPSRRRQLVAAAGPAVPSALGVAVTVAAAAARVPELAPLGLPLAGHAVCFLAFSTDGRRACGI